MAGDIGTSVVVLRSCVEGFSVAGVGPDVELIAVDVVVDGLSVVVLLLPSSPV